MAFWNKKIIPITEIGISTNSNIKNLITEGFKGETELKPQKINKE